MISEQELISAINNGLSLRKISKSCGISVPTLSSRAKNLGLAVNTKFKKKLCPTKVIEEYKQGRTISEIAVATGSSSVAVYHHLKKSGIEIRGNKSSLSVNSLINIIFMNMSSAAKTLKISRSRLEKAFLNYNKNHDDFLYPIESFKKKYKISNIIDLSNELCSNIEAIKEYMYKYGIELNKCDVDEVKTLPKLDGKFKRHIKKLLGSVCERSFRYKDFSVVPHYLDKNRAIFVVQSNNAQDKSRRDVFQASYICIKNGLNVNYVDMSGIKYNPQWNEYDLYYANDWSLFFDTYKECHKWLMKFGFQPLKYSNHILERGVELCNNIESSLNANINAPSVINLIKHFSPHFFYSCRKGYIPISDAWRVGNKTVSKDILEDIWNDGPNIYKLITRIKVYKKDFNTVSVFKPWVASFIYDKYLPDGGVVIDPCMGWGGRLLGCMNRDIIYKGYDLNENAVESNKNLYEYIKSDIKCAVFRCDDSGVCKLAKGDMVFTSPPYDSIELYHGIDSRKTITRNILNNIFSHSYKYVIINVHEALKEECVKIAEGRYRLHKIHKMRSKTLYGDRKTYNEPIMVFEIK